MSRPSTLVELLEERATTQSSARAYTFLDHEGEPEASLTWAGLASASAHIAALIADKQLARERILVVYPAGVEFLSAYFACLLAGAVAVPVPPPSGIRGASRLRAIAHASQAAALLLPAESETKSVEWRQYPELRGIRTIVVPATQPTRNLSGDFRAAVTSDDIAMLQYTSGSTANPKGVALTHDNILRNERAIFEAFGHHADSVVAGWLPHYHDMGLIGNLLQTLYAGLHCVFMAPSSFVQRPANWLKAISRYGATTSGAPNFAYDLCARRLGPAQVEGVDLSSWKLAFCGAERIRAATLDAFARSFASCGFRASAFYPCYGLAEATLFVSGGTHGHGHTVGHYAQEPLTRGEAVPTPEGSAGVTTVVSCGRPIGGCDTAIVDPLTGLRLAERCVGEVWLNGETVAEGYWQAPGRPDLSAKASLDGKLWLRTGDLAFVDQEEIYVIGRLKDVIIVRGVNYFPDDLEAVAEACDEQFSAGRSAAFAFLNEDEEALAVALELRHFLPESAAALLQAKVRGAVVAAFGVPVTAVELLPRGALPTTSSGKVRRAVCRQLYTEGCKQGLSSWWRVR